MIDPDEDVARYVVRRIAGSDAGTDCPDANLLVGFAEGTLTPGEEESVATHLAGCAACREAVGDIEPAASSTRGGAGGRRWWPLAAAAAVLVAVGAAALLLHDRGAEPQADTTARLVAAAKDLARERPALFADFVPLGPGETPKGAGDRERGGVRLLAPSDVVLPTRPEFRWVAAPGATNYEVSLATADGATLWTRAATGNALAYPEGVPELAPGTRYEWSVAFEGVVGGRTEGRRRFTVASQEDAQAFKDASRAIVGRVAPDLRDLLLAQFALRRGLVGEAERPIRAHLARHPADEVGRATLRHLLLLQGSPEAEGPADRDEKDR